MLWFNPCILQKAKKCMNQTVKSGSAFIGTPKRQRACFLALCCSLFLVGSCNENSTVFDFSTKPADLTKLSKSELIRHGYALQVAMIQTPENISKLTADDVKLALSSPDFSRQDGGNHMWQYRTDACVLDIFWKQDKAEKSVSHFEFRQRRSVLNMSEAVIDPVKWQCVQQIIQDHRDDIEQGFSDIYAVLSLNPHKS